MAIRQWLAGLMVSVIDLRAAVVVNGPAEYTA